MMLRYGDDAVPCRIRRSGNVSDRLRIHVYPDGAVEIEAPLGQPIEDIAAVAQRRARWVFRHRRAALARRRQSLPREYVSGETHFYLGRRHKLMVIEEAGAPPNVKLLRGRLEVTVPFNDRAAVRTSIDAWYSARASEYLATKLAQAANVTPWVTSVPCLKLVKMKTQWGSCTPDGTIRLNPALVRAPRHCIDYVIVHELCHLVEHNHSRAFFELLTSRMRDWKQAKQELDSLAELILADG